VLLKQISAVSKIVAMLSSRFPVTEFVAEQIFTEGKAEPEPALELVSQPWNISKKSSFK
jgi:hypothetical protein